MKYWLVRTEGRGDLRGHEPAEPQGQSGDDDTCYPVLPLAPIEIQDRPGRYGHRPLGVPVQSQGRGPPLLSQHRALLRGFAQLRGEDLHAEGPAGRIVLGIEVGGE